METAVKTALIIALFVSVSLGLYVLVDSQFSMQMGAGGMSPGFSWLLQMRAAENDGQIAPSFEELQASGSLPPFMQGALPSEQAAAGARSAPLSQGFEPEKIGPVLARDLLRLTVFMLIAIGFEMLVVWAMRRRHNTLTT